VNLILYAPPSAGKANLRSWIMAVAGRSAQVKALAPYAVLYQILYTGRLIWPMKPSMPVAPELLMLRLAAAFHACSCHLRERGPLSAATLRSSPRPIDLLLLSDHHQNVAGSQWSQRFAA
jgi:hypothetical protein